MNIEDYRDYCLSLGNNIEEKLPFQKFKSGEGVLVFTSQATCSHSSTATISPSSLSNANLNASRI